MKFNRWICTGWILLLLVIGVGMTSAQGITPPSGEIAFTSNRSGTYQIYLMNADGSNVRQLTHETVNAFVATWSPNGQKLLYDDAIFDPKIGDTWILKVINGDGSQPIQIAENIPFTYRLASWSLDSQWLLYADQVDNKPNGVRFHRVKADGTSDQLLDFSSFNQQHTVTNVSFVPDGKHLLVETVDGLYTTDLDGSHARLLTLQMTSPDAFSPDKQSFIGTQYVTNILKTDSRGNHLQPMFVGLTSSDRVDFRMGEVLQLGWSPNDYYIWGAVSVYPTEGTETPDFQSEGTFHIFIGTANGDDYWMYPATVETTLSWSPDSQWVAYTVEDAAGHNQVAISRPIGTNQMILTSSSDNSQPAWRPAS